MFVLMLIIYNIANRIIPSPKLSYIWEGCLKAPKGSVGKIKPHAPCVTFPYNSPFRKLPILTNPSPMGIAKATPSNNLRNSISFLLQKINKLIITPTKPP